MNKPLIWSPRPERDAGLEQLFPGIIYHAPILRYDYFPLTLGSAPPPAAIILTSAAALRPLLAAWPAAWPKDISCFAVGAATAEAVRTAGFSNIITAAGNAASLLPLLYQLLPRNAGQVLWPRGQHIALDLGQALQQEGYSCHQPIVYQAVLADELPEEVQRRLAAKKISAALFYSVRTADTVIKLCRAAGISYPLLTALCYSQPIAEFVRQQGIIDVRIGKPMPELIKEFVDAASNP